MPYPAQIEPAHAVEKARELIEAEGADGLTLAKLATVLKVSAPSLYRHFASKADLLRAVNLETTRRLTGAMLEAVARTDSRPARAAAMAAAYRHFAHANPAAYLLAFSQRAPETDPAADLLEGLALPLQQVMAELVGEQKALSALRGLWALAHGFSALEISGQFRRGGDLEAAFRQSVTAMIAGWGDFPGSA